MEGHNVMNENLLDDALHRADIDVNGHGRNQNGNL